MDYKIIKTKEELLKELASITYGSIYIYLDSALVKQLLPIYITQVNNINKDMMYMAEAVETIYEDDAEQVITYPGVYRVSWADKTQGPPLLTTDELKIPLNLQAIKLGDISEALLSVRKELHKYAKKEAEEAKIKISIIDDSHIKFYKAPPKKNVYGIIQKAMDTGESKVVFSRDDVAIQTLRVYSSQISKFSGKSTSVSLVGDKIILYITDKEESTYWSRQIETLFKKMIKDIGESDSLFTIMSVTKQLNLNSDSPIVATSFKPKPPTIKKEVYVAPETVISTPEIIYEDPGEIVYDIQPVTVAPESTSTEQVSMREWKLLEYSNINEWEKDSIFANQKLENGKYRFQEWGFRDSKELLEYKMKFQKLGYNDPWGAAQNERETEIEESAEPTIEIVDGVQQYTMPIKESESSKSEYDEFN